MGTDLANVIEELIRFRDDRDWKQFHDTKNLATAISIEAAELNELFLWKDVGDSEKVDDQRIKEELADVILFALLLSEKRGYDLSEMLLSKIRLNKSKYPIEKSKGTSKKYTEL